jgi:hypothetical protein
MLDSKAQSGKFHAPYWAENWRRTWRDWRDLQALVGFILLILAFLGYGWVKSDQEAVKWGLYLAAAYVAARFLVVTPWMMWNAATRTISELEHGMAPHYVQAFLDHANLSATSRYLNITSQGMHAALARFEDQRKSLKVPAADKVGSRGDNRATH